MSSAATNNLKFSDDFKRIDISLSTKSFNDLKDNDVLNEDIVCNIEIVEHAIGHDGSADNIYCFFKPISGEAFYRLIFKQRQHNLEMSDSFLALENQVVTVKLLCDDEAYKKNGSISIDSWYPPC